MADLSLAMIQDVEARLAEHYAGVYRLMFVADSIGLGAHGLTGGWRKKLEVRMDAAGLRFEFVGPLSDFSQYMHRRYHHCVSGQSGWHITPEGNPADAVAFAAAVAVANPTDIFLCHGMNDLGTGRTVSQFTGTIEWFIDTCNAEAPAARIYVPRLIVPSGTDFPGYVANAPKFVTWNTTDGPATAAAKNAFWVPTPTAPVTTDGVHPAETAGGYDSMDLPIFNAFMAQSGA